MSVLKGIGGITFSRRIAWTGYSKEKKMPDYKWFKPERDNIGGLNENFLAKLDKARDLAGFPFVITSGFRTPQANQSILGSGAVSDSSHLQGLAVDLAVENDHEVYLILFAAMKQGISRFGIYINSEGKPTHVHLDDAEDRVNEVIWIKGEGKPNSAPATA